MKFCLMLVLRSACIIFVLTTPALAGEFGLGLAALNSESEYIGLQQDPQVLPLPFYQGDKLEVSIDGVSWLLLNSEVFSLKAEGQGRFDGFDPADSQALEGLNRRRDGIDLGLSLTMARRWGEAKFSLWRDVSGASDGYEVDAVYKLPIRRGSWLVSPGLGFNVSSARLVDYYYGVDAPEVTRERPQYGGESAIDASAGGELAYRFSAHSQLLAGIKWTVLGKAKRNSPLVDQDYKATGFVGFLHIF